MRRGVALAGVAAFVATSLGASAAAPTASGFQFGVAAGEVTSTSAVLWTRLPRAGKFRLEVLRAGALSSSTALVCCGRRADDLTVSLRVPGLRPGTRYAYRFRQGSSASPTGTFKTAPIPSADARVRFAFSGDADATPGPDGKPAFNRFQVYARMAAERNDFNVNLGDTIYSDSEVPGSKPALTVAQKLAKYRLGLALPALRTLRASAGLYSQWDDHEFINDFSRPEFGDALYRAGVTAFRDYTPVTYSPSLGLYRSFRWGENLELFFLDERSFRGAKVAQACGGDLAPTLPQSVRDAFGSLAPSLRNPPPAGCVAAIDDPSRTMLGAAQYAAFTKAIKASTATFKVVVNEVPIQQFYALPYDRWEGYEAERTKLLRFLQANVKNVVFLTTDTHANLVNQIRYQTLGGPPVSSGMWEVVTGPVATNTFAKEIDGFLGSPGAGAFIGSLFFKPQPPAGVGMRCAALDVYSYGEVTVTRKALTVALRDARGNLVRDQAGAVCPALRIQAQ
jgi:alkaline phosphatase D